MEREKTDRTISWCSFKSCHWRSTILPWHYYFSLSLTQILQLTTLLLLGTNFVTTAPPDFENSVASCLSTFHPFQTSPSLPRSSFHRDTKRSPTFLFTTVRFEWVRNAAWSSICTHLLGNQPIDQHCMHSTSIYTTMIQLRGSTLLLYRRWGKGRRGSRVTG